MAILAFLACIESPAKWQFLVPIPILAADQVAIVVDDAAPAVVPVIKLRPVPTSVASLATGPEYVTPDINITAGLDIGTTRNLASSASRTLQLAVVIDDFAIAVIEMIKRTPAPIAITGVAFRFEPVSMDTDVPTRLGIRATRSAPSISTITVTVAIAVSASVASELSIDIADAISASVIRI